MTDALVCQQIRDLVQGMLQARNLQLVDFSVRFEGERYAVRILADRPAGGITLRECLELNRFISGAIEEQELIKRSYIVEVFSPGLDRPLRDKSDFLRCLGRRVRVFLNDKVEDKLEWEGSIGSADEEALILVGEGGPIRIPLSKVNKAKQLF